MAKVKSWAERIEALQLRHSAECEALADQRVADALGAWRATYPERPLFVGFGMGAEWITISGRSCDLDLDAGELRIAPRSAPQGAPTIPFRGGAVRELIEALRDVLTITDGYRAACPSDASTDDLPAPAQGGSRDD